MIGAVGRSLELFFIDGKPDGMQTAEVFNWTGRVLFVPRTRIKAALEREEAAYTGLYLLLGDKDGVPFAYIGETENISERIRNHDQKKDWWSEAVLVTTAGNALNKAHVKYLESRLVEIALAVKRRELENGNTPPRSSLSEAAQANMEAFLGYLMLVLPALRIDMFQDDSKTEKAASAASAGVSAEEPLFELHTKKHGLNAEARLDDGDFVVLEGSSARLKWEGAGSWDSSYAQLHDDLLNSGVLVPDGDICRFTRSYAFRSPSAAAAVVNGRPANGTVEWKLKGTTKTYKDWEAAQLGS
jgi:hypothetical protein